MPPMRIRFVSSSRQKIGEAQEILSGSAVEVIPVITKIEELQTFDSVRLVEDKCARAFAAVGWPLFVEHTSLAIDALNGLPGGLTQGFWDTLQAQGVCSLVGLTGKDRVTARSDIAYCDGRRIHHFCGETRGRLASAPRGSAAFYWDSIFIPDGSTETFAEMSVLKNSTSMRAAALSQLARHIDERQ